jgi:Tfp pilus assembly protein FimT
MRGMSLIELVVVTAIIMVLAGGGGVALNSFNEKQKVVVAKDELVATLRLARNAARTAKGPSDREMKYVKVNLSSDGTVVASDDIGLKYIDKDVTGVGVGLKQDPEGDIYFLPYNAGLGRTNVGGKMEPVGASFAFAITTFGEGNSLAVIINSNGLIDGK